MNRDKRYQLGNYAGDWRDILVMVKEISDRGIVGEYEDGVVKEIPWQDVKPLDITVDLLKQIGFGMIKNKEHNFHREVVMATIINGKHYNCKGILYDDHSLWVLAGISVRYFHQVQNIMSILEPTIDLRVHYIPQ